jgi:isoquinoline 1-oxidoreductase beta subunit
VPTRRDVLRIGAVGGAALVLGVRWDDEAFAVEKPGPAFVPNVWIRIDRSGRTWLTCGKSEMGQGVRTSLPMILADELDADWAQVRVAQASPGPAFPRLGTGGSWSVGGSWQPLRQAGAAARAMLVAAAAARWGVDPATCRTERGAVIHAGGRTLRYGALVAGASRLPVPAQPRLKAASEFRIIGTGMKRFDGPQIVSGAAKYGIDATAPRMAYASIERAPAAGCKPARFDAAAARSVRGVRDVLAIAGGVAVVADGTWAAMKGRAALHVEWERPAGPTFDTSAHGRRLEEAAREAGVVTRSEGQMPPASGGARVVEARYYYPFAAHAPVEPMNCVAHVHDGRCDIWAPTQSPNGVQRAVAELLGLAPGAVGVNVTLLGGGFGRRLNVDYAREAAEVARHVDVPVQVLWTRADDMRHGHFQAASIHEMWGAVEAGRGVAWRHKKVSSLHNLSGPPSAEELKDPAAFYRDASWGVYDIPYAFPAIETAYVKVDAPIWIGPWRSVFSPSSTYARECFVDELAQAAGKDPLDFRLSLLGDGAPDTVKAGDLTIDRRRLRRVLELAAEKSGWRTPPPPGRFRGVACNVYDGETHVAYVAEVSLPEGRPADRLPFVVHRMVCAVDCGVIVNPLGIEQQVDSGVAWGLSNMKGEITFRDGAAEQASYRDFPVVRMSEMPVVETHLVPSHGQQPFGIGEPTVPPVAPAVANAVFAATGRRIRRLPVRAETA